ncbi:NAD(P)-dependent oxidoreductase [Fibrivirga algicola]|uniref:2-hydroxyacid dehydrogenase n=1 Tax=Fibrivirga algicola TaxID=2950420 RepID=A0ABX0QRP3_9BACT|nr:NAD(P)-dependent oxidoreductase [Fibrivirga algicola]NID12839.1 2-hydroxyacid dehydrogenase [Fibrivirga algicola]
MKAIAYSVGSFEEPFLRDTNHAITLVTDQLSQETVEQAKGYEAVLIFGTDEATKDVLARLSQLGIRYLLTRSAGTDHIDQSAADQLGIDVKSIPAYSPGAIAEYAVALMLTLGRHVQQATDNARQFNFKLTPNLVGFELRGKTVGIAGYGNIGQALASILAGFGCHLLAYDSTPESARPESQVPIEAVSLEGLLTRSDIISLHLPLTDETQGLFNHDTLSQMKPGAMLINTGRGAILKTADAIEALKSGQLGYLGIDVYEHEHGLFFEDRSGSSQRDPLVEELLRLPNALVTGHQAFLTREALQAIARESMAILSEWESKAP